MASLKRGQIGSRSINKAFADSETLPSHTVAQLALAPNLPATNTGRLVHCTNGAGGSPCLAYSDGTSWLRILLGAAVSVTP